jgi:hypothetical protein
MPRYYFDIKHGHRLVDPSGLNFKDDDDAIAKAEVFAIAVSLDQPAVDPERHIAVLNDSREEIFRGPVYSKPSRIVRHLHDRAVAESVSRSYVAVAGAAARGVPLRIDAVAHIRRSAAELKLEFVLPELADDEQFVGLNDGPALPLDLIRRPPCMCETPH